MIFWRGFGIGVFVIFLICAWIMSYQFDDTSFGNGMYMGYTMLCAFAPTLVMYLALRKNHLKEKELAPGEIAKPQEEKSKIFTGHSFFFIPVAIWPLIFLVGGLYFSFSSKGGVETSTSNTEVRDIKEDKVLGDNEFYGELVINFWNPYSDSTQVITYYDDDQLRMDETIAPNYIIYGTYDAGLYSVETRHYKNIENIDVRGSGDIDEGSYHQGWYVLNPELDLLLVDVNDICADIMESDVRAIDWSKRVEERYIGGTLIVAELISEGNSVDYKVIDPDRAIPTTKGDSESIYALVPINYKDDVTDEYLDDYFVAH